MNYQILLFLLCLVIIMMGYHGYKEIRKLNTKIIDMENSIKCNTTIKLDNMPYSYKLPSIYSSKILETNKIENVLSHKIDKKDKIDKIDKIDKKDKKDKIDKIDDKFKFNESELTKELARDFANFHYCSDSTIEQEESIIDNENTTIDKEK